MEVRTIQRVLVACRGETGASVARRVEAAGFEAVALYADVDAEDTWLDEVSFAARISADAGADPYADTLRIVSAALDAGSDAVHPGTGRLATNGELARMVANVGLAWIGATPILLDACASRSEIRRLLREAGFPVVPSSPVMLTDEEARPWLARFGVPLRLAPAERAATWRALEVRAEAGVDAALAHLAGAPFTVERALTPARHVVVAVLGDGAGNAMHLGDSERSLVFGGRVRVRECPAPALDAALRERLTEAAVRVASGVRLLGAGSVEFLVGADARWWLHDLVPALPAGFPLHDVVYGLDIVGAQVRLAAGETLGWAQEEVVPERAAIELTLCATGPGDIDELSFPDGVEVSTVRAVGAHVDPAHDPVIARIRLSGPLRQAVLVRARAALESVRILGVPHDTDALVGLLAEPRAWEGHTDTMLLESVVAARSASTSVE
jgi:acetyl/propionyl-CoA carboxylase alpha subunit